MAIRKPPGHQPGPDPGPSLDGATVLICGGRSLSAPLVTEWLMLHGNACVASMVNRRVRKAIHGAATGADTGGRDWGERRGLLVVAFPARWNLHGAGAGPVRNQQMIDEGRPDCAIAFPGGKGTEDMVRRLRAANIPVHIVEDLGQ